MQELKPIKEGKVREIYDNGDSLIMVATDRISCFDVILNNEVTKKGTVLTQMSNPASPLVGLVGDLTGQAGAGLCVLF